MNLYELSQNYLAVQDMDLEPETLKDTLDSIEEAIEVKAENIAKWIRNLEADKKAFEEEEKRFKEKKQAADNRIKSLKLYLEDNMRLTGKTKFKAGFFSFASQNNPPSVEVFDEALLPERFLIAQPVKIDRAGIKELLKAGEEVPGAELKHSSGLRIR